MKDYVLTEKEKQKHKERMDNLWSNNKELYWKERNRCPNPNCLSMEREVRNHSLMWGDGDIHCKKCGCFIRYFDAG